MYILKAKVVKNRIGKYNVHAKSKRKYMPICKSNSEGDYNLLEWRTEDEAVQYILNHKSLVLENRGNK